MAAEAASPALSKADKKQQKKDKKRAREEDPQADAGRKLKKSKSVSADLKLDEAAAASLEQSKEHKLKAKKEKRRKSESGVGEDGVADVADAAQDDATAVKEKKKKKKKDRQKHADQDGDADAPSVAADSSTPHKKHKKKRDTDVAAPDNGPVEKNSDRRKNKKDKKSKKLADDTAPQPAATPSPVDPDAMDIDESTRPAASSIYQPPDMPASPQFPFFTQTVSLYEPLYPTGWAQPVTSAKYQHLQHLQNKYVPALRGVLLDYRNVVLGPAPGRGPGTADDDDAPTTVMSRGEYAVGFGWITADVDLFVPSRGAWMEGSVNLQTEGHIGVVCFGRFNASIEARRLPPAWKWVSNESSDAQGFEETASVITADDHGVVRQIHSTGFWVDGTGARIMGKTRFRIRNFDAGTSGDTSYLSLEGTMLDKDSERRLVEDEARAAQARRPGKGGQRALRHRAPDFSMTRFAAEEAEEDQGQSKEQDGEAGAVAEPGPETLFDEGSEQGPAEEAAVED